jgi:OOP family OmpA-OmpF porin
MNKTILNLTVAASLGFSAQGFAHEGGMVNDAYVGDSRGHIVTDGSGDCVRTSSWSEDKMIEGCGLVAVVAEPAPAPPVKVVTETVSLSAETLFDVDKDVIKPAGKVKLDDFAARLSTLNTVESVSIVGHTDSTGTDAYNQALSMRRANSVKNYLLDKGVSSSVMSTSGMGESQPVASNATSEGRTQNRRVEVSFTGTETEVVK